MYHEEMESISHCVMATLPLMADNSTEIDEDAACGIWTNARDSGYCSQMCRQMCLVIGVKPIEQDICLCRLGRDTSNSRLLRESKVCLVDDVLPLKFRCILLAALCPITADSNQHDTTLTSVQRILADSSRQQDVCVASLVSLPTLLMSLASLKGDQTASTRYLLSIMESFDFDLVLRHSQSEAKMVQVAAFLSMARLNQMYVAASLLMAKDDTTVTDQLRLDATAFLCNTLNPSDSGIDSVLLGLLRFDASTLLLWNRDCKLPSSLTLSHDCTTLQLVNKPPHVFLATHIYLQSTVSTMSRSVLGSLNGFEFFGNHEHYSYFDQISQVVRQNADCEQHVLACVPLPAWVLLAPFVAPKQISKQVAKSVGPLLLSNQCRVFSILFISKDKINTGSMTEKRLVDVVEKFFREIEYLLIKFFRLPRPLIILSDDNTNSEEDDLNEPGLEIAVLLYQSLCLSAPLDSAIGVQLFKQSFLRLIRIWVGGTSNKYSVTEFNTSSFCVAYDAIKRISDKKKVDLLKCSDFAASILREFFLPSVKDSIPWARYQLLVEFIESCLLPHTPTQGFPMHGLDVPNNVEVVGFIDEIYPSVLASMIFNEDIEGLEMCAAFRMYVVSDNKKQKRAQKKSSNEHFIVGKHLKKNRSSNFARDLVAGVRIAGSAVSAKSLTDNTKMLCWKSDVIEYVLPKLLLHSDRSVLKFFADLCPPNTSLSQILQEKDLTVLKTLVWELGAANSDADGDEENCSTVGSKASFSRNEVVLALKMGYLIKEGHFLMSASDKSNEADDDSSARKWIGKNFLYLLVNVVLYRWKSRTEPDKFRTINCLKAILKFLPPDDSLQYMPQVMVAIGNAMGSSEALDESGSSHGAKLRFLAVSTLFDFVKILASHQIESVGDNLTTLVVILFPLFEKKIKHGDRAREEAAELLMYLAGKVGARFSKIPFLPTTPDLQCVRAILAKEGVFLDDIRITSQQMEHSENATITTTQLHSKFYAQMNILSDLIATHENKEVRRVVILHMTKLIQANRDIFANMIENENFASMNFLTVVHNEGDSQDGINSGFITKLMMRLLSRCVEESDRDIRDAIASCLGEIGAIDHSRLGREISASQVKNSETDNSDDWRLKQPPWKSGVICYQLRLVTQHLVSALKSSTSVMDQHKIGFAIQELLQQIDFHFCTLGKSGGDAPSADSSDRRNKEMSIHLKEKLDAADVRCIVEPFWTSIYQQQDISAEKKPPFFTKSNSYFRWLSSFCRFLVTKSHSNEKSLWSDFFYACRSAIRSQAGVSVAEFLLPVLVLDVICFGEKDDQEIVISEFLAALSPAWSMQLKEREKSANTVFSILDTLRHWAEQEMEQISQSPKSKRSARQSRHGNGNWPVEESISKINQFLKHIPLSACADAASHVGMNSRALRFLEIESRGKCGMHLTKADDKSGYSGPKYLKSEYIDGINLSLAHKLLGKLNDFDTMVAISQKSHHQSSLTTRLAEEAGERELCGDVEGSCQAYEQLLDTRLSEDADNCNRLGAQQGLLRCLLKLGRLDSVINQACGMSSSLNNTNEKLDISQEFVPFAAEAAWRLGNWSILEQVSKVDTESIDASGLHQLNLGRVMHSLHIGSSSKFTTALQEARESVMTSLSSAARDSYAQSYPLLMQLHALREVELSSFESFGKSSKNKISSDEWAMRLNLSTPDSTGSNVIVNTRLALCRMMNEPIAEGLLWLDVGKMTRKGGLFQVAEQSLTHADLAFCSLLDSNSHNAVASARESIGKVKLQFAKLKYALGEPTTALNLIENIPPEVFHLDGDELEAFLSRSDQSVDTIGRLVLQATDWMVSDGLKSGSEIRSRYQTVLKLVPCWERAHFHYGKYLDILYESCIAKSTGQSSLGVDNNASRAYAVGHDEKCQKLLMESVNQYGISLQLGQKHVFQALPRMLAMWLEFTAVGEPNHNEHLLHNQSDLNKLVKSFISKIPEHLFYTALPQLISCIIHCNKDSSRNVMQILIAVLTKYPCQTVWACNWLRFSKALEKQKAGDAIFNGAKRLLLKIEDGKKLHDMLDASKELYNFLLQLAKHNPSGTTTSFKMRNPTFAVPLTEFIPPVQSALSVTPGALDRSDVHEVFPQFVPRMRAFNLEVKVMQSKAKPKRISFFAIPATAAAEKDSSSSDIGEMHFLVKQEAKGDLRKDSRVQDLNNVINRLFAGRKASSGSDSRRQCLRLHLRTFSVVCLAEDCGILEWVPNTDSFRSLVGSTYNPQVPLNSKHRHGDRITNYNNIELREAFMRCQEMYIKKGNLRGAAENFEKNVLQEYRPFMYWWFVQNFSNPHAWFEARNNFTLSTAVWSAVGHIIGLGDRHSENILVDTRSGECVHVDFDCIFDKGLLLPRPEVIPFRLTPNMIDAFGPTGSEGLYNGALVESMKTLRRNRDTLLSVLEPFLKDPVINFSSSKNQQKAKSGSAKAADAMRKIDGRLNGMYNLVNPNYKKIVRRDGFSQEEEDDSTQVALSVEGQVQRMIAEATSHENLVQVYVGWMPWI